MEVTFPFGLNYNGTFLVMGESTFMLVCLMCMDMNSHVLKLHATILLLSFCSTGIWTSSYLNDQ
jgi:hypothetical protein